MPILRKIFFLLEIFLVLCSPLIGILSNVPVYDQGRYLPLEVFKKNISKEEILNLPVLPSQGSLMIWLPLKALNEKNRNFTAFSNQSFDKIRLAYSTFEKASHNELTQAANELEIALLEGYHEIAGKPYLTTASRNLTFPTLTQLKAESLYHRFPWIFLTFITLLLTIFVYFIFRPLFFYLGIGISFLILTFILLLRVYVLQRPPVSNMFETLLFVPWLALFFSIIIKKESIFAACCLSFILMSILVFGTLDDSFGNIQPVLDSHYWLTIHVLLVVGSYSLFLLAALLAHGFYISILRNKQSSANTLSKLIRISMYIGLIMLISGTILGGIWAAQSWGRFWDWDPKESWAFITICVYLLGVHAYTYRLIDDCEMAFFALLGAWSVTFTWYGVNYILGTGLHSYGFGQGGVWIYLGVILADIFICTTLALLAKKKNRYLKML